MAPGYTSPLSYLAGASRVHRRPRVESHHRMIESIMTATLTDPPAKAAASGGRLAPTDHRPWTHRVGTAPRRQDGRLSGEVTGHEEEAAAAAAKGVDSCVLGPIRGRSVALHAGAARAHPSALHLREHHREDTVEPGVEEAVTLDGTHHRAEANEMVAAEAEEVQATAHTAAPALGIVAEVGIVDESSRTLRTSHSLCLFPG